ncbi:hypothetical protein FB566_0018 [Stackebrandtia endophytica]|uniref:Uncharacterized protein n=1 Tax=Stackebrandtia endophytica TaxID=1496996 RepID=A0A543APP9_9ACTN|nr:hypothetical protein [Stackebrandtia endophytica]TQL74535.1 hypothetical protein FB566_0018 [Stackebrandtia endophytica]
MTFRFSQWTPPKHLLPTISMLRMVFLFAPILVAWYGVHEAAAAYQRQLDSNPDAESESFFRGWLDGFDGTVMFTFEQMAIVVFSSVAILILLSITAEAIQARIDQETTSDEAALLKEVSQTLTKVADQLERERNITAEELMAGLTSNAETVTALTTALHISADNARDATTKIATATEAIETTTVGALDTAAKAADTIKQASGDAAASINTATGQLTNTTANFAATIDRQHQETNEILSQFNDLITDIGDRLTDDRHNFQTAMAQLLPDLIAHIDASHTEALDSHRKELTAVIQPLADQLAAAQTNALAAHTQALTTAMNRLADSHDRHSKVLVQWAPHLAAHTPRSTWLPWRRKRETV